MGRRMDLEDFRTLASGCTYSARSLLGVLVERQAALEADPWVRCGWPWRLGSLPAHAMQLHLPWPCHIPNRGVRIITYVTHKGQYQTASAALGGT